MPLYEYKCLKCGRQFEKRVGYSDDADKAVCPACRSESTERVISRTTYYQPGSSCDYSYC